MNLALFVTQESLAELPEIVARMAELQQETVNGACVVIHDGFLKPADIAFTLALARCFKASASLPVQVNGSHSDALQKSSMFSRFLTSAYARYPGPWLVFDEPALPKQENFMQALLKQHGAYGGKMTGRAATESGSATPIGPVTLELDFKLLRFLRFPARQSWRERGQFLFARSGFQLIPAEEWLFSMKKAEPSELKLEVESTQSEIGVFRDSLSIPGVIELPDDNPARYRFMPDNSLERVNPTAPQINPDYRNPSVEDLPDLSNSELVDIIVSAGQPKPHHFTGREKLLSMARELQATPA